MPIQSGYPSPITLGYQSPISKSEEEEATNSNPLWITFYALWGTDRTDWS